MLRTACRSLLVSVLAVALAGCPGKKDEKKPALHPSVAYRTKAVLPGSAECTYGGVQVDAGVDENGNGVLDAAEVDGTEYVCNGAPGADSSLVSVTPEDAGAHCLAGGLKVASGLDADHDAA